MAVAAPAGTFSMPSSSARSMAPRITISSATGASRPITIYPHLSCIIIVICCTTTLGSSGSCSCTHAVTEDRQTQVDFSDTYATGVQSVIVTEDSDIKSLDDLKGKQIGVQQGTTGDLYSTDDFGEESVQRFSKGADAVQALSTGKIDAVIIDNKPAQVFVDENDGLKLLETPYAEEEYAIAVKKGNTELLDAINASIANLKESGKLDEIVAKYITAE